MKTQALAALGAGLALLAAGCSGSGSSSSGTFEIQTCSLGCTGTGSGGQIGCGIQDVFVNGEIRVTFSAPVDPSSVDVFSFQVTEEPGGQSPPAFRFVDPNDPRTVVYRPQLSFDSSGSPVFGLGAGKQYQIKIPGTVEDPGSDYIRSTGGKPNRHRLSCKVTASLGVLDFKPGDPEVTTTVEKVLVDPVTGDPILDPGTGEKVTEVVEADGAQDVWLFSQIVFHFDDLMNPATLVNPVTGLSNSIQVVVDPDGIVADPTDQQPIPGTFTIALDQDALDTTVVFTPSTGFPSAGSAGDRKIVVNLPASISDLGGNPLDNSGVLTFTPELIAFPKTTIVEGFDTPKAEDKTATGATWGGGALTPGLGGGSGLLGGLSLAAGEVVTLSTDSEDFTGVPQTAYNPANHLEATFDGVDFVLPAVTGGVFEFASLKLSSGSRLRFVGDNPARVYVRGEADVKGVLDVSGADGGVHNDKEIEGGTSSVPGPSGALGGQGGHQPTWVGFEDIAGTIVPPDPKPAPPTLAEMNGQPGMGVEDNLLSPTGLYGEGEGGLAWPQPTAADPQFHMPVDETDIDGLVFDEFSLCQTKMKAGVGAGGAFGLNGGPGENKPIIGAGFPAPEPPPVQPGLASEFGLGIGSDPQSPPRKLDPDAGWLHGGAGGGGGGGHLSGTTTNGVAFFSCETITGGLPAVINIYNQHSGGAGGPGGGGVQLQAGRRLVVDGIVDASGGQGQGRVTGFLGDPAPGGSGSGGSVLLQSPAFQIPGVPGRLDISGGTSAIGIGASLGGRGGAGLLRLETTPPLPSLEVEATKVSPSPTTLAEQGASPSDIISIGQWIQKTTGAEGFNGAQSCWIRPEGNFFLLDFEEDAGAGATFDPGWDMTVQILGLGEVSWRQPFAGGPSLEELVGSTLGSSPLVVRFQGVRSLQTIDDPCAVKLSGLDSPVFPGSLTGWVDHPADLNDFFGDPALRPNMIRFQVIYDTSDPLFSLLLGVTEITIQAQPD